MLNALPGFICAAIVAGAPAAGPLVAISWFHVQPRGQTVNAQPISCRIDARREHGLVHLSGVLEGDEPTVVHASLSVRRSGRSGVANNAQSGVFIVEPGIEMTIGQLVLNATSGDDLSAELVVTWDGGEASCAYP